MRTQRKTIMHFGSRLGSRCLRRFSLQSALTYGLLVAFLAGVLATGLAAARSLSVMELMLLSLTESSHATPRTTSRPDITLNDENVIQESKGFDPVVPSRLRITSEFYEAFRDRK